MDIIEQEKRLYALEFNPETDTYGDKSPFRQNTHSPALIQYTCPCKCNSNFFNNSGWKSHIKSKTNIYYKEHYNFLNKPLLDAKKEIINLKRENNTNLNKIRKAKQIVKGLKNDKLVLEGKINELKELPSTITKLEQLVEKYKADKKEVDDYSLSSSDDEDFEDCS